MAELEIARHLIMAAEAQRAALLRQQRCVGSGMGIMALAAASLPYGRMQVGVLSHLPLLILVTLPAKLCFGLVQKAFVARDMGVVTQAAISLAYRGVDEFVCEGASVVAVKTVLCNSRSGDNHQQQDEQSGMNGKPDVFHRLKPSRVAGCAVAF
jgi:hypothetical protein